MSEVDAALAAPAENSTVVSPEAAPHTQPVHSDMADVREQQRARAEAEKAQEPEKPKTLRDTIKAADAKLKAKTAEPKKAESQEPAKPAQPVEKPATKADSQEAPKVETKTAPERDPTGKFVSQQPKPAEAAPTPKPAVESAFKEAPKRFSDDAKGAWEGAPEPVRAEIHRAVKEMEEGINKHRQQLEPLKPYLDLAQKHGKTVPQVLDGYMNLERMLRQNPEAGLQKVAEFAGINLREFSAKLLNQHPDDIAIQQDKVISSLNSKIADLEKKLGSVSNAVEEQKLSGLVGEVTKFAEKHPRFDELAEAIKAEISHGFSLEDAYKRAELLNPAPAAPPKAGDPPTQPVSPASTPETHTLKGTKSISGAPDAGSTPAKKRQASSKSIREALENAAARAG